jgi:ABC-type metal ion transport system substrate-binding protein
MLAGLLLAGCDQKNDNAKHIKVGVINGAEQDPHQSMENHYYFSSKTITILCSIFKHEKVSIR